jgi:hypothetical protein
MKTDTPETDAMVYADQHHLEDDNFFSASVYWRICDLARRLERELATVTEQRDEAREALKTGGMLNIIDRAHHERAAAIRQRDEAREQLAAVTEQRDEYCPLSDSNHPHGIKFREDSPTNPTEL